MLILPEIRMSLRSGDCLATVVCLPSGQENGPWPAVLIRSPYSVCEQAEALGPFFCGSGTAVVLQDCRGTGRSDGEADFWRQERDDAEDALNWLSAQSWFNGRCVMTGESYDGSTQWQALRTGHAVLKGVAPHNAPADGCRTCCYPSGVFAQGVGLCWTMRMRRARLGLPPIEDWTEILHHDPLTTADEAAGVPAWPFFRTWTAHPLRDRYWDEMSAFPDIPRFRAPACITGGWFDPFLRDSLQMFTRIRNESRLPDFVRSGTKLLIEPVDHTAKTGDLSYGRFSRAGILNLRRRYLLDVLREPEVEPLPGQPPVRLFVMGSNRWIEAEDWPLPFTPFHLYLRGRGTLAGTGPEQPEVLPIVCGLRDPVPTVGGADLDFPGFSSGQRLQNEQEKRADVLLFTSEPLTSARTVIGYVKAVLYVSADSGDADFTVKLCDVFPDGSSYNVCGGIARMSLRNGDRAYAPAPGPEEAVRLEVDCGATAMTFAAGHRIRIQVSWSDFPRFRLNPAVRDGSVQRVHFGPDAPSHILLPLVSETDF